MLTKSPAPEKQIESLVSIDKCDASAKANLIEGKLSSSRGSLWDFLCRVDAVEIFRRGTNTSSRWLNLHHPDFRPPGVGNRPVHQPRPRDSSQRDRRWLGGADLRVVQAPADAAWDYEAFLCHSRGPQPPPVRMARHCRQRPFARQHQTCRRSRALCGRARQPKGVAPWMIRRRVAHRAARQPRGHGSRWAAACTACPTAIGCQDAQFGIRVDGRTEDAGRRAMRARQARCGPRVTMIKPVKGLPRTPGAKRRARRADYSSGSPPGLASLPVGLMASG